MARSRGTSNEAGASGSDADVAAASLAAQYADGRNLNARLALHERFSVNPVGWFRWLGERLAIAPGSRVLDVGCGTGRLWADGLACRAGWWPCLADASPGMARDAARALARGGEPSQIVVADVQALCFAPATFDAVIANHMLYHVADRPRALREIARVLAPAGRLFASTVGENHMAPLDEWLLELGVAEPDLGRAMSAPFTLENGGGQLAAAFHDVETHVHDDELRVTEVEPIVAYVRSAIPGIPVAEAALDRLRARFAAQIAAAGAVHIPKASGLFVARAPR